MALHHEHYRPVDPGMGCTSKPRGGVEDAEARPRDRDGKERGQAEPTSMYFPTNLSASVMRCHWASRFRRMYSSRLFMDLMIFGEERRSAQERSHTRSRTESRRGLRTKR